MLTLLPRRPCMQDNPTPNTHLHVAAMELHQLHGLLIYVGVVINKLLHQRVPQVVTVFLDDLNLAAARRLKSWGLAWHRHIAHMQALPAGC